MIQITSCGVDTGLCEPGQNIR